MKIDWSKITWDDFEEFCWHLLDVNGFRNLEWIGNSGDRGRDILATKNEYPFDGFEDQRIWVVQCKRHKTSPSPGHLRSSIAWADGYGPDYFLLIMPCRISSGTRDWLEKQSKRVNFKIIVLDKPHLERQLLKYFEELSPYLPPGIQKSVRKYIPTKKRIPAKETMISQPSRPPWTTHMNVLREQALDPWIDSLRGVDRDTVVIGGLITIESSTMGSLSINREVRVSLPEDPTFKYSEELFQHLRSKDYSEQYDNWIELKENYGAYIKETKGIFETICGKLIIRVSEETGLVAYNFHGLPPNKYFASRYLSYIIYQNIGSIVLYGKKLFEGTLQINKDKDKAGVFFASKGSFSRLVQGKKWQCKKINEIVAELERDKHLNQSIKALVLRRKELDNHLSRFIEFLEKLSKLIENGKPIQGICDMCPK